MDWEKNSPEMEEPLPSPGAETGEPAAENEFHEPQEYMEFTPPGSLPEQEPRRKRRRRKLYYAAAAVLILVLTGRPYISAVSEQIEESPQETPSVQQPAETGSPAEETPVIPEETKPEETPEVSLKKEPELEVHFWMFSHEHHGTIRMSNTSATHSVRATVRETTLDQIVWEKTLDEDEIRSGLFEIPELSTGDFYEDHMSELNALNAWPEFELTVTVRYESEDGTGEEEKEIVCEAAYESGYGFSYWDPGMTWNEQIPPDSFVITPWDEIYPWDEPKEIRYVLNDPDAVEDPDTICFDVSYNGRHVTSDECFEIIEEEKYDTVQIGGTVYTDVVIQTKRLVIPRPDWIPPSGTVHVVLTQLLTSTGELYSREFDYSYSPD